MRLELYRCGEWIVVEGHRADGAGTVYYPTGDTTLSVAANFGEAGDSFADRETALAYFRGQLGDGAPAEASREAEEAAILLHREQRASGTRHRDRY